jgi:hypothetical protein
MLVSLNHKYSAYLIVNLQCLSITVTTQDLQDWSVYSRKMDLKISVSNFLFPRMMAIYGAVS